MVPVSLDYPFLIVDSVFSNLYLITETTAKPSTFSVRLQPFDRTLTTKLNIVLIFFQKYMCEKLLVNVIWCVDLKVCLLHE